MRKFVFFVMLAVSIGVTVFAARDKLPVTTTEIYVIDAELMRLIPVEVPIIEGNKEQCAKFVIKRLITGFDENPKIRRLIPDINNGLKVYVRDNTAYVDISKEVVKNHPAGRDLEKLSVYSIVNSLMQIKGINGVKFTVDKKVTKKFMGYLDMREVFRFEPIVG